MEQLNFYQLLNVLGERFPELSPVEILVMCSTAKIIEELKENMRLELVNYLDGGRDS